MTQRKESEPRSYVEFVCSKECHVWRVPDGWQIAIGSLVDPHGTFVVDYREASPPWFLVDASDPVS